MLWGEVHQIPFIVSEADISLECIALCPVPWLLSFKLETPDGKIIDPLMSGVEPNIEYVNGNEVVFYRIMLPALPGSPEGSHAGTWRAIFQIKTKEEIEKLWKQERISVRELGTKLSKTLPYNFIAQCYSNLTFAAKSIQTSLEPGASVRIEASLKEYDFPIANRAGITAHITKPDLSNTTLALKETEPGIFEAEFKTTASGNYSFRLIAKGSTIKGRPFTREKTVTAGVFIGGDKNDTNNNFSSLLDFLNEREKRFCELLNCIFSHGVLNEKFEKKLADEGIDLKHLRECLKSYCSYRKNPEEKYQLIDFEKALADPGIKALLNKLGTEFFLKDETFGFAMQPNQRKKEKDEKAK